jgi:guanylate kinase
MYKIVALMGEAGSGKDSCLKALLASNPAYHEIISCTSRPPREGEIDGVNYYFTSIIGFKTKIVEEQMLEWTEFNDWFYGTPISSLDENKINVGVFNPEGVRQLANNREVELKVYYLRASDKERLLRQLNREENPCVKEIIRRFSADKEDFEFIRELGNNTSGRLGYYLPACFFYTLQNETKEDLAKAVEFINADNLS